MSMNEKEKKIYLGFGTGEGAQRYCSVSRNLPDLECNVLVSYCIKETETNMIHRHSESLGNGR